MPALFTKKHLLEALAKANLPHSYLSLLRYERSGVIPSGENSIERLTNRQRLYSKEEIADIVERVRNHKR